MKIWNGDYVFSRRMKVPKKLREKYHLKDDATFADAIKVLTKESEERPLDNISRRTQDHILGEFADSQEELRAAKAQRAMEKEQQLHSLVLVVLYLLMVVVFILTHLSVVHSKHKHLRWAWEYKKLQVIS